MPQNALNLPTTSNPISSNQRLITFVIIALSIIFAFTFKARWDQLTELHAEIHMWEARTQEAEAHRAALYKQLLYIKSDEYVVAVAREELGLTQEGDELIVVVGNQNIDFGLVNGPNNSATSGIVHPMNMTLNLSGTPNSSYSAARDFLPGDILSNGVALESRPKAIWEQWLALFFYSESTE